METQTEVLLRHAKIKHWLRFWVALVSLVIIVYLLWYEYASQNKPQPQDLIREPLAGEQGSQTGIVPE